MDPVSGTPEAADDALTRRPGVLVRASAWLKPTIVSRATFAMDTNVQLRQASYVVRANFGLNLRYPRRRDGAELAKEAGGIVMLAKIVALALLILAASPLTQPFSTVTLGDLPGAPAQRRSADDHAAVGDVGAAAFPDNPPVDVRPLERRQSSTLSVLEPCRALVMSVTMAVAPRTRSAHYEANRQRSQCAPLGVHAVLRL
jgi:hypothetical protein